MNLALATDTDKSSVLSEALANAGKPLERNQADLDAAIDKNRMPPACARQVSRHSSSFLRAPPRAISMLRCLRLRR